MALKNKQSAELQRQIAELEASLAAADTKLEEMVAAKAKTEDQERTTTEIAKTARATYGTNPTAANAKAMDSSAETANRQSAIAEVARENERQARENRDRIKRELFDAGAELLRAQASEDAWIDELETFAPLAKQIAKLRAELVAGVDDVCARQRAAVAAARVRGVSLPAPSPIGSSFVSAAAREEKATANGLLVVDVIAGITPVTFDQVSGCPDIAVPARLTPPRPTPVTFRAEPSNLAPGVHDFGSYRMNVRDEKGDVPQVVHHHVSETTAKPSGFGAERHTD